jgi:plastocyanin
MVSAALERTGASRCRARALVGALAACAIAACGSGSNPYGVNNPPATGGHSLTIQATPSLAFTPSPDTVAVGSTVTFAFGSVAHNVFFAAAAGAPADIPGANANVTVTRAASTAGTFTFACHLHPGMSGTLVVR